MPNWLAEGLEAAATVRRPLGRSDPAQADPTTIRGRFGIDSFARARTEGRLADSVIHSSDCSEDVEREFDIWFGSVCRHLLVEEPWMCRWAASRPHPEPAQRIFFVC